MTNRQTCIIKELRTAAEEALDQDRKYDHTLMTDAAKLIEELAKQVADLDRMLAEAARTR